MSFQYFIILSLHSCNIARSIAYLDVGSPFPGCKLSSELLESSRKLFIRMPKHDHVHTWFHFLISVSFCSLCLLSPQQRNHCYYQPNCREWWDLGCAVGLWALQELAAHDCSGSLENNFCYATETCEWHFYSPTFVWWLNAHHVSFKRPRVLKMWHHKRVFGP